MKPEEAALNPAPDLWLQIALPGLWLALVFGCAELLNRRQTLPAEVSRKVVHIGVGNVMLIAWWLAVPTWLGLAASGLFALIMALSYRLPILRSINGVGRASFGTLFYAISLGLLMALFWAQDLPQYAVLGMLVMAWGDGLAALVGQNWGKHPYTVCGVHKSWEGSATMAVISYLVVSAVLSLGQGVSLANGLWIPLGVALGAAALEVFSWRGLDNLSVPLGSAALAWGLSGLFTGALGG